MLHKTDKRGSILTVPSDLLSRSRTLEAARFFISSSGNDKGLVPSEKWTKKPIAIKVATGKAVCLNLFIIVFDCAPRGSIYPLHPSPGRTCRK